MKQFSANKENSWGRLRASFFCALFCDKEVVERTENAKNCEGGKFK